MERVTPIRWNGNAGPYLALSGFTLGFALPTPF